MPPVITTGVSAIASSPDSTPSRDSAAFCASQIRRDRGKEQDFGEQDPAERQLLAADVRHATALRAPDSTRSDSSAARMIAPCKACSQ